ncbi:hypothetical protein [Bradyrhizobium sp. HKCCYLS2033]|uniref:hypothetical protein n=1 Tax=unclassified Bradyrhizobium TaxID=2631580 RepID=UPI003EB9B859
MRFYVTSPGEMRGDGVDFDDIETVLMQTADTALAIARDRLDPFSTNVHLEVSSDDGRVGHVTVSVLIERH